MKIKLRVRNFCFITIHNAFVYVDSPSSIPVTNQIQTHVHTNYTFPMIIPQFPP